MRLQVKQFSAIAGMTALEATRQPILLLLTLSNVAFIALLPFVITRDTIVSHQEQILPEMDDAQVQMLVADELAEHPDVLPRCLPLYLALSPELQAKLVMDTDVRNTLKRLALQGGRNGSRELLALHDRLRALGVMDGSRR